MAVTATGPKPITSTVSVQLTPQQVQQTKSYFEMFKDFLAKGAEPAKAVISTAAIWSEVPGAPPEVRGYGTGLKNTNNFIGALEAPKKTEELTSAVTTLLAGGVDASGKNIGMLQSMSNVIDKTTSLIKSLYDGFELNCSLNPTWTQENQGLKATIGKFNFCSTMINGTNGAINNIQKIYSEKDASKKTLYGFHLGRNISYGTLGTYGLFAPVINPLVILACSTSGLFWTVCSFFIERSSVEPEGKGLSVPDSVIADVRRQIVTHRKALATA